MNEERYVEIRVEVLNSDEEGMNVNMHTEVKNLSSREVAHCLAEAVNDILRTNAEQTDLELPYLKLRFLECLTR